MDRLLQKYPDRLGLARSPAEARSIVASGRVAMLASVEGGSAIEESLDILHEFFDRGARYLTLTHQKTLTWAESGTDGGSPAINGLSDFGRRVALEMERMGMMIDLAHVNEETFWAVLQTVKCPVIVTHAAAAGISPHHRNLTDAQIKAIAERGGVIGVIYEISYLDSTGRKPVGVGLIADHIDYIKQVGGIDVIALGSDWDGSVHIPPELGDASRLPNLTAELLRRGYTHDEIKKILGKNFLRAWAAIEAAAGKN
jgi:membrane dipeptidase